jgi:non-specific serine/threonine protein kinase
VVPDDRYGIAMNLAWLASIELGRRRATRAARLLGAAEALRRTNWDPTKYNPEDRRVVEETTAAARAALGEAAFDAAWAAGAGLTLEQAAAEARGDKAAAPVTAAPPSPRNPAGLTRREAEVLRLLAHGATDAAIARQLSISVKTVNAHVASILGKTGSPNRAAAAAFAVRHGLGG